MANISNVTVSINGTIVSDGKTDLLKIDPEIKNYSERRTREVMLKDLEHGRRNLS